MQRSLKTRMRRPLFALAALGMMASLAAQAVAQEGRRRSPAQPDRESSRPTRVRLETNQGDIVIELNRSKAPVTVANFEQYVKDGFYDGLIFHRVISDSSIQAGGYDKDMKPRRKGLRPPIKNESDNGLKNVRGAVAMARAGDPNSATSQFFINVADNPQLDYDVRRGMGYAVFGRVVEGMDVVDRIRFTKCVKHPDDPAKGRDGAVNPERPVIIKKATLVEPKRN